MGLHDNCSVAQRGPETREETREERRPDTPKTAPAVPKETHTNTAARYGRYGAPSLPDANMYDLQSFLVDGRVAMWMSTVLNAPPVRRVGVKANGRRALPFYIRVMNDLAALPPYYAS